MPTCLPWAKYLITYCVIISFDGVPQFHNCLKMGRNEVMRISLKYATCR